MKEVWEIQFHLQPSLLWKSNFTFNPLYYETLPQLLAVRFRK